MTRRNYIRANLTAIASDAGEQATGSWNDGGLLGWEIEAGIDPQKTGEEAARQALVNLTAKPCPSGRMPVIIGNGFGGVIFHEACGHSAGNDVSRKKGIGIPRPDGRNDRQPNRQCSRRWHHGK